jgi:hypothetical protein
MIPPLMSSTMNGEDIFGTREQNRQSNSQNNSEGGVGRPKKEESELSEKTIQNKESM